MNGELLLKYLVSQRLISYQFRNPLTLTKTPLHISISYVISFFAMRKWQKI